MRFLPWVASALLAACQLAQSAAIIPERSFPIIAPKVFIVDLFDYEAGAWYEKWPELLAVNISVPGLSMLYPAVHCTPNFEVCQVTTGEAEINAATTMTSLVLSGKFDLRLTYFLIAGIAGVNPKQATLGGVALSRFSVSVALQYEFDAREMPANFSTGYFAYGTYLPNQFPESLYGTEVFELNEALRDIAFGFASRANLSGDPTAQAYGDKYGALGETFLAATRPPSVAKCDVATSDVYYSGNMLSEAFENTTAIWTNGSGVYCMTAQEDTAVLEVLVRMAIENLVDFSRVILMRTGSDFDRPPPGISAYDHLLIMQQNGFEIALQNIYLAGIEIVNGILHDWQSFAWGIRPTNYIGDILGSLGGEPDFGPGSIFNGRKASVGVQARDARRRGQLPTTNPRLRQRSVGHLQVQ